MAKKNKISDKKAEFESHGGKQKRKQILATRRRIGKRSPTKEANDQTMCKIRNRVDGENTETECKSVRRTGVGETLL